MQLESMYQNKILMEYLRGFKFAFLICLGFLVAALFQGPLEVWPRIFAICFSTGFIIYSAIFFTYVLAEAVIEWREESTGKDIHLGVPGHLIISLLGVTIGATLSQVTRAMITGREVRASSIPEIVVIGVFISLMFIYREKNLHNESENKELSAINQKLKALREKKYLSSLPAKIGNSQKIIQTDEITHFLSLDHYTYAYTQEGEYIVDFSLKRLSDQLNPNQFIQIHRNCIIALKHIDSIENGNQWFVKSRDGEEFKVSRNSRNKLKELFL